MSARATARRSFHISQRPLRLMRQRERPQRLLMRAAVVPLLVLERPKNSR